ncbi:FAD-linked oxidase C-terminal domain-containing protein [Streptomyces sp. NPDC088554]|uniref:FAD-linked oxidase C-terminal domain-containing protein n=1 Tax=Streptomyces sp. NPDC088554 TaxID=3365865 RepID=UPI0038007DDE
MALGQTAGGLSDRGEQGGAEPHARRRGPGGTARVTDDGGGYAPLGQDARGAAADRAGVLDGHQRQRPRRVRRGPGGRRVPARREPADRDARGARRFGGIDGQIDRAPVHGLDEPRRAVDPEPPPAPGARPALRLGGSLTGEHGVGTLKRQWLADEPGPGSPAPHHG